MHPGSLFEKSKSNSKSKSKSLCGRVRLQSGLAGTVTLHCIALHLIGI
jgi:hypothetical protein